MGCRGEELLEMGLHAVLLQPGVDPELVGTSASTSCSVIVSCSPFGFITVHTPSPSTRVFGAFIQLSGL